MSLYVAKGSFLMALATSPPVSTSAFFVTGGTLRQDAACYVARQADTDLYASLTAGEYCYVLNSRQMGKSSLMVRASQRLKAEGHTVAVLDLTAIGQNLTPEQWYDGLLARLGRQLDMEDDFDDFYQENERLGPLQRCFAAIETLALPGVSKQLIVFVDEIDVVRSLPFSADEFFAAVRQCYVERATNPAYNRLTFCLLGTATPADLVTNTRLSPFNIGKRIEIRDFTNAEAAPLAAGLGDNGKALLQRVLYWTGGHPYLTQRLCRSVAEQTAPTPARVDSLCSELFLTHRAKDTDDNLTFVRNRLLNSEADLTAVLELYRQVWQKKRVPEDETNPLTSILKLSGVAGEENGLLRVRNRIYAQVFDKAWIAAHMPDAELRRQKQAFRRGVSIAGAMAGLVLSVVTALAVWAVHNANFAHAETARANRKTTEAEANLLLANQKTQQANQSAEAARKSETVKAQALHSEKEARQKAQSAMAEAFAQAQKAREAAAREAALRRQALQSALVANIARESETTAKNAAKRNADLARQRFDQADYNLYVAKMNLVQRDWDNNNTERVRELLAETKGRGRNTFEWNYWDRLCHMALLTLKEHSTVLAVAFSPDGSRLLTGSWDNTARLWNASTGREMLAFKGHNGRINSVAFSPDGKRIVTGSYDGTAKVWDATSGRELLTFKGHGSNSIESVAFSPDGRRGVTSGEEGTIRLWDSMTGQELLTFKHLKNGSGSVAFSPDGKRIVTGGEDYTAKVWDAITGRELLTLKGHGNIIFAVAFSPDGRRIVTGSGDNTAKVWDTVTGQELLTFREHTDLIRSVAFSPDGKRIVTGSNDGTAKVWDAQSASKLLTFRGKVGSVASVAFSPEGSRIVMASADQADLRDARTDQEQLTFKGHEGFVTSVAFSPDGKNIVTGSWDETARLWNAATGRELLVFKGHNGRINSVAFSPDGKRIVTGSNDKTAKVWDATNGRELLTFKGHGSNNIDAVAFSPDGRRVVTSGGDYTTKLWDALTGRELLTLKGIITSVAFSPDGKRLLTGSWDETAKVWEVASGRELLTLKGHVKVIHAVAFSPDGTRIVTGGEDMTARTWNARTGAELHILKGHGDSVRAVGFSPDGKRIVTGSEDKTARMWDSVTGRELLTLKGHDAYVTSVAFSPDGKRIVTGSWDQTAKIWFADGARVPTAP